MDTMQHQLVWIQSLPSTKLLLLHQRLGNYWDGINSFWAARYLAATDSVLLQILKERPICLVMITKSVGEYSEGHHFAVRVEAVRQSNRNRSHLKITQSQISPHSSKTFPRIINKCLVKIEPKMAAPKLYRWTVMRFTSDDEYEYFLIKVFFKCL